MIKMTTPLSEEAVAISKIMEAMVKGNTVRGVILKSVLPSGSTKLKLARLDLVACLVSWQVLY